jgi:hypothetical protein
MWDLWWTKWSWDRFSSNSSVSPANLHSTSCSTITIYHLDLAEWASSGGSKVDSVSPDQESKNNTNKTQNEITSMKENSS